MRKVIKILLSVYLTFLSIFLVVEFTPLEFTAKILKQVFYQYTLLGLPILGILIGLFLVRKKYWNIITSLVLGLIGLSIINYMAFSFVFFHNHSIWETKEVIAIHKKRKTTMVAEQWINSGTFGYAKGIYKITKLTPFLDWRINYYGEILDDNWEVIVNRKLEIGN